MGSGNVEGQALSSRPHCPPRFIPSTGSLNLLVRSRNKGALDTHAWSLSGNKGNVWQQAHVPINPSGPFQVSLPGPEAPHRLSQPVGCCCSQEALRKALCFFLGNRAGYGGGSTSRWIEGKVLGIPLAKAPNPCFLLSDLTPDYF